MFRWLGGIPIDRGQANDVVAQSIEHFERHEKRVLTIPPAGTRKRVLNWKTGFYHIANGANVPIALGFLDYKRKVGGIGKVLIASGVLMFGFVAYQLWGTGIETARAQNALENEFEELLAATPTTV